MKEFCKSVLSIALTTLMTASVICSFRVHRSGKIDEASYYLELSVFALLLCWKVESDE